MLNDQRDRVGRTMPERTDGCRYKIEEQGIFIFSGTWETVQGH